MSLSHERNERENERENDRKNEKENELHRRPSEKKKTTDCDMKGSTGLRNSETRQKWRREQAGDCARITWSIVGTTGGQ